MPRTPWTSMAAVAALMLIPVMPLRAQRIGIVAGGTFSHVSGLANVTAKSREGTMFGATITLPLSKGVALQPEALFINKGSAFDVSGGGTRNVKLDYLEVPLLLRFDRHLTSAIGPHFYLGPSVGFNLSCSVTVSGSGIPKSASDCTRDDFFHPAALDWSAIAGAGLDLSIGVGVTGGARYGVGLANVSKDDGTALQQRARNGTLTVYAGVLFGRR